MEKKNIQAKDTQGSEKYFSQLLEKCKVSGNHTG
jgi:hypothetical protein